MSPQQGALEKASQLRKNRANKEKQAWRKMESGMVFIGYKSKTAEL
jgi:hypothetical protein